MPSEFNYDGRTFGVARNSSTGETGAETLFHYHQQGNVVWAEYAGGAIQRGTLLALMDDHGCLDMRYQHVNQTGQLQTGICRTTLQILPDGRYQLNESWQWTSGDLSKGESVLEEI